MSQYVLFQRRAAKRTLFIILLVLLITDDYALICEVVKTMSIFSVLYIYCNVPAFLPL